MATVRPDVSPLPPTTRIELDPGALRLPGNGGATVLIGGSPYTVLTLKPAARALLDALQRGEDLGTAARAASVSNAAAQRLVRRLLTTGLAEPVHTRPPLLSAAQITAVVPVLNEAGAIGGLVVGLKAAGILRVIVVDDGSSDTSAEKAEAAGAEVLHTSGRCGPGAARNVGLERVATALVLFIDADTHLIGDWLGPLLLAFADPEVGAVAPRISSRPAPGLIGQYEFVRSPLDLGARRASVRPRTRVAYVPSAVLLAEAGAIRNVGGFDTALRTGEDVDFVWRLVNSGRTVRYEPAAVVEHRPRPTVRRFAEQRRGYGRSAAALDARHPGFVAPVAASGWSVLAWGLAALGGPLGVLAGLTTALSTAALLEGKLGTLAEPRPTAWKLALRGHWGVGRQLASAVWRAWLPLALVASLVSRRARRATIAAALVPNAAEWLAGRPPIDPVRFTAMRLLDDTSYCVGVWEGCWRQRSLRALLPHLADWPGRRDESRVD